jgi:hypothetical protein
VVAAAAPVPDEVLEDAARLAVDFFGGKGRAGDGGSVGGTTW